MSSIDALDGLAREHLHPLLRERGFRRQGTTWWYGSAQEGWVLIVLSRWKYNEPARAQFSVDTVVWPVGTWETEMAFTATSAQRPRPDARLNAPLFAGPRELMSARYGDCDWPWSIQTQPVTGLVDDIHWFCVEHAIPSALEHLSVDIALRALTDPGSRWTKLAPMWSLIYACGMLARAAPDHDRFSDTVIALRDAWLADPRPDFLQPTLQRWCQLAEVPFEP
ncbi:hypothetical protein C8N24_6251 [Solirubrobacter pauli]|uniref:DUF4304 domain-containing protein n=1 Tax=Solirubrobacter pauli TaxID=166793 RepID=A0A660L9I6_9ACTN|nr:hypothetical protein [Solirubrobacter pauli]RKQ88210.1 hypothetical protein C8N24_6251 [Solirubrobacter pauli]